MRSSLAEVVDIPQRLTEAEQWELMCWDERVKNAEIVLGMMEGERRQARARIAAGYGIDVRQPFRFLPDGRVEQGDA